MFLSFLNTSHVLVRIMFYLEDFRVLYGIRNFKQVAFCLMLAFNNHLGWSSGHNWPCPGLYCHRCRIKCYAIFMVIFIKVGITFHWLFGSQLSSYRKRTVKLSADHARGTIKLEVSVWCAAFSLVSPIFFPHISWFLRYPNLFQCGLDFEDSPPLLPNTAKVFF